LRFSLGRGNTKQEIEQVLDVLPRLVERLRTLNRKGVDR
jgi:cysteine sulfinate desulfinase/cysteine desulfurase-like protein